MSTNSSYISVTLHNSDSSTKRTLFLILILHLICVGLILLNDHILQVKFVEEVRVCAYIIAVCTGLYTILGNVLLYQSIHMDDVFSKKYYSVGISLTALILITYYVWRYLTMDLEKLSLTLVGTTSVFLAYWNLFLRMGFYAVLLYPVCTAVATLLLIRTPVNAHEFRRPN